MQRISPERCDLIISEARVHSSPRLMMSSSCVGWRVPPDSEAAALLAELGWPSDDAQVVGYGAGGGYGSHVDGNDRKMVVMIQLSDPDTYEGGTVDVEDPVSLSRELGSVSSWSATSPHGVGTVTKGERWALVAWTHFST